MAGDGIAGGWTSLLTKAQAAEAKTINFLNATFGGGGTAEAELTALQGQDPCSQQKPAMLSFLTSQTTLFHSDIVAWNKAQKALWVAQSRWGTAVFANVASNQVNKAYALVLDSNKQFYLSRLASETWNWEDDAQQIMALVEAAAPGPGDCPDSLGPDQEPPATTVDKITRCPEDLARAKFSFSLSIFKISVNCEKVTIGTSAPGLGPFVKLTVRTNGDFTVMAGVKAGVSLGPASVGVDAGAYLTMHGDTVKDVGVTASASAGASAGPISLSGPSASATVTIADVSAAVDSLIQP